MSERALRVAKSSFLVGAGIVAATLASCGGGGSAGSGNASLVQLLTTAVPAGDTGVAYATQLTAQFPNSPGSFLITGGALPIGLALDHNTGVISGYPREVGTYHFEVAARDGIDVTLPPGRDASFAEARQAFTVQVALGLPNILPQILPAAQYRASYGYQIDVAGGTPPYFFSQTGGSLPSGITVGSSGFVGSFPTQAQPVPYDFEVTVTDSHGLQDVEQLQMQVVVLPLIIFTSNPIQQAAQFFPYDIPITLASTGGGAPFTWSQLPPVAGETLLSTIGMQITSLGHLTDLGLGVTGAPGTYLFTIKVTDEPLQVATRQYSLKINPGPVLTLINPKSSALSGPYTATGLNFQPGAKLNFKPGPTQTVVSPTFVNATTLTFNAPVPKPSNGNGAVPVQVQNPDGGTFTLNGAFVFPATNIAFNTKGFIPVTLSGTGLDAADVNVPADGYADLVMCGSSGQQSYSGSSASSAPGLVFLKNLKTSPPTFSPTSLDTISYYDVKFADVNTDGKLDVVALGISVVKVFLGNGDGTFGSGIPSSLPGPGSGYWPSMLTVAKLNSDAIPDIAFGQPDWPNYSGLTAGNVYTMSGSGSGSFSSMSSAIGSMPTTYGVPSIVGIDTDGDGRAEICAGIGMNSYTGGIWNYSAMSTSGTFNGWSGRGTANAGYSTTPGIGVGDFLGTGVPQIVTASTIAPPYGNVQQVICFSGSTLTTSLALTSPGVLVKSCMVFDGDFDAKMEIAVSTHSNTIMIYRGSTQANALTLNASNGSPSISSPITGDLASGDLDGDGANDVIATTSYWQTAGMGAYYGPQQGYGTTYCILTSGDGGQLGLVYFLNTSN